MTAAQGWELPQGEAVLSVGIISADPMHLAEDLGRLETAGVSVCHFDVMDGHFCPMLTVGGWFVGAIQTTMLKDVHLMVENPVDVVEEYVEAGADIVTVHLEAGRHVHRALERIAESGEGDRRPLRGLGLNPGTPVAAAESFLDTVDVLYVLGINPGWRQPMLPSTLAKVRMAQDLVASSDRKILIAVDGGITPDNFGAVAELHPDIVVTGSAVFSEREIEANLGKFLARKHRP